MTTAQEAEKFADWFRDSHPETVVYPRQYAEMLQKYADAVTENVRLREAMDEMLLIERCAKVCEKQPNTLGVSNEYLRGLREGIEDRAKAIRALKEAK